MNAKELKKRMFDCPAWLISSFKLKKMMGSATSLREIVDVPFNFVGRGYYDRISASQDVQELFEVASIVQQKQPKVIVEIGTYKGGTLFVWTRSNPSAELIISIDLPGGNYGGGYSIKREKLYRLFAFDRPNTEMHFIREDSHLPSTLSLVKNILKNRKIDFLYIDADHTYDGVKSDFENYSSLVAKGGVIGFHDIYNKKPNHQVQFFWEEIKKQHPYIEILGKDSRCGNGLIFL